mmetsp:Transcript_21035/g.54857  ORF Transcript_21035/g.54857 Transcript_21035/m.54857 type:complete len:320 (-) Transcript_21035:300-1259(-)
MFVRRRPRVGTTTRAGGQGRPRASRRAHYLSSRRSVRRVARVCVQRWQSCGGGPSRRGLQGRRDAATGPRLAEERAVAPRAHSIQDGAGRGIGSSGARRRDAVRGDVRADDERRALRHGERRRRRAGLVRRDGVLAARVGRPRRARDEGSSPGRARVEGSKKRHAVGGLRRYRVIGPHGAALGRPIEAPPDHGAPGPRRRGQRAVRGPGPRRLVRFERHVDPSLGLEMWKAKICDDPALRGGHDVGPRSESGQRQGRRVVRCEGYDGPRLGSNVRCLHARFEITTRFCASVGRHPEAALRPNADAAREYVSLRRDERQG